MNERNDHHPFDGRYNNVVNSVVIFYVGGGGAGGRGFAFLFCLGLLRQKKVLCFFFLVRTIWITICIIRQREA